MCTHTYRKHTHHEYIQRFIYIHTYIHAYMYTQIYWEFMYAAGLMPLYVRPTTKPVMNMPATAAIEWSDMSAMPERPWPDVHLNIYMQ